MKIYISIPEGKAKRLMLKNDIRRRISDIGCVDENKTENQLTSEELVQKAKEYDVIVSSWGCNRIKGSLLENHRLKAVVHLGGTVKPCVDADVFDKGITVMCGNSAFPPIIAESILYQMLTGLKRWHDADAKMKANVGTDADYYSKSLYRKKVGLIGYGKIASHLIKLLKPFETEIMVADKYVTEDIALSEGFLKVSEQLLCSECDVISIQHTLNNDTYHLVDSALINTMKASAVIVNMARGAVIDEKALINRLKKGDLFAVLDVFEEEPLDRDSELRKLSNVFLTPHLGAESEECCYALADAALRQLELFCSGKIPPDIITKKMYMRMSDERLTAYKKG